MRATAAEREFRSLSQPSSSCSGSVVSSDCGAAERPAAGNPTATEIAARIDALARTLAAALEVFARGDHRRFVVASTGDPEVMDADQLAAFLGVDRKTVYDYAGRGQIPHRRLGKRLLFSRSAIVAWLGACKAASREG